MAVYAILIGVLWFALAGTLMVDYAPLCSGLSKFAQVQVFLILTFGAPFFAIANILEAMLDMLLPEGWDNDGRGLS